MSHSEGLAYRRRRHTAASVWLRDGIDVVRAAAWLGDTPAIVLGTYAHLMPGDSGDDGRAAVDRFFSAGDTLGGGTEADHG